MRREVADRAGNRCEYCLIHQDDSASKHQADHIIAEKHGGTTILENLAESCLTCNRRKSSEIGALDPGTGQLVRLFHPRVQRWCEHFRLENSRIEGLTAEGRATVEFLQLNSPERLLERAALIRVGRFPMTS